jgi:hypothetical protein
MLAPCSPASLLDLDVDVPARTAGETDNARAAFAPAGAAVAAFAATGRAVMDSALTPRIKVFIIYSLPIRAAIEAAVVERPWMQKVTAINNPIR